MSGDSVTFGVSRNLFYWWWWGGGGMTSPTFLHNRMSLWKLIAGICDCEWKRAMDYRNRVCVSDIT